MPLTHGGAPITRALAALAALALAGVAIVALAAHASAQPGAGGRDAPRRAEGRYAEVNGLRLYYEIHGAGKPLILLHGGLGAIDMFGPALPELAKGRQVIAVDLQGHGRTADIDRPLDARLMADDIAALVRHLRLGRVDIMGFSLGANVALQAAVRHPEVVDRLVAVSAIVRRSAQYPELLALQAQVTAEAAEGMKQTPMYQLYAAVAPRPQDWPRLLGKIGEAMRQEFDYSKEVAGITAPTLIVAADADLFPPAHAVEVFGLLGGGKRDGGWDGSGRPASRLAILPGRTHYDIVDDPALVATAIRFLDEPAPQRR